ncbi:hypothetical protein GCM10020218_058650 [Dactylosporangium vinaceum]
MWSGWPDSYDVEQYLQHLTVRLVTRPPHPGGKATARPPPTTPPTATSTSSSSTSPTPATRSAGGCTTNAKPAAKAFCPLPASPPWTPSACAGTRWQAGLDHATAYRAREGHLRVPPDHVTADGYPLGSWIRMQRKQYTAGRIPADRATVLEALGIEWHPYEAMWQRGITAATAYHARHHHLQVPDEHTEADGYRLANSSSPNACSTSAAASPPTASPRWKPSA